MRKVAIAVCLILILSDTQNIVSLAYATLGTDEPVPLKVLYRSIIGSSDRTTSSEIAEASNYTVEGQILYLSSIQLTGTIPFYRYFNGSTDHKDSINISESGYSLEGTLGYGWTNPNALPGLQLAAFNRARNVSSGDRMSYHQYETLPAGYQAEATLGYGFRRHNNTDTAFINFSAGGISVDANRVAGGSIWNWAYNGKQFLNTHDCGRQLQIALQIPTFYFDSSECGNNFYLPNPDPWKRHSAYLTNFSIVGTTSPTFQSTVIPIDSGRAWCDANNVCEDHWETSAETPNMWLNWRFSKQITLNFNGMGPVAQFRAIINAPIQVNDPVLEFPMIYLRPEFNRFFTYDVGANELIEVTNETDEYGNNILDACDDWTHGLDAFQPVAGGVIISTEDQQHAMGIYVRIGTDGARYLAMWKFFCHTDESENGEQYDFNTSKLSVVYGHGTAGELLVGNNVFTSYVVNGTVAEVRDRMRTLWVTGY